MQNFARLTFATLLLAGSSVVPALAQDAVVQLSPDQQTTVIQDFSDVDVAPAPDVNVTVGAEVPQTVTLQPVPEKVVKVVPAYSKYKYFKDSNGGIIIVEPSTMKVVTILK